jgi:uncharacterized membrane protein
MTKRREIIETVALVLAGMLVVAVLLAVGVFKWSPWSRVPWMFFVGAFCGMLVAMWRWESRENEKRRRSR